MSDISLDDMDYILDNPDQFSEEDIDLAIASLDSDPTIEDTGNVSLDRSGGNVDFYGSLDNQKMINRQRSINAQSKFLNMPSESYGPNVMSRKEWDEQMAIEAGKPLTQSASEYAKAAAKGFGNWVSDAWDVATSTKRIDRMMKGGGFDFEEDKKSTLAIAEATAEEFVDTVNYIKDFSRFYTGPSDKKSMQDAAYERYVKREEAKYIRSKEGVLFSPDQVDPKVKVAVAPIVGVEGALVGLPQRTIKSLVNQQIKNPEVKSSLLKTGKLIDLPRKVTTTAGKESGVALARASNFALSLPVRVIKIATDKGAIKAAGARTGGKIGSKDLNLDFEASRLGVDRSLAFINKVSKSVLNKSRDVERVLAALQLKGGSEKAMDVILSSQKVPLDIKKKFSSAYMGGAAHGTELAWDLLGNSSAIVANNIFEAFVSELNAEEAGYSLGTGLGVAGFGALTNRGGDASREKMESFYSNQIKQAYNIGQKQLRDSLKEDDRRLIEGLEKQNIDMNIQFMDRDTYERVHEGHLGIKNAVRDRRTGHRHESGATRPFFITEDGSIVANADYGNKKGEDSLAPFLLNELISRTSVDYMDRHPASVDNVINEFRIDTEVKKPDQPPTPMSESLESILSRPRKSIDEESNIDRIQEAFGITPKPRKPLSQERQVRKSEIEKQGVVLENRFGEEVIVGGELGDVVRAWNENQLNLSDNPELSGEIRTTEEAFLRYIDEKSSLLFEEQEGAFLKQIKNKPITQKVIRDLSHSSLSKLGLYDTDIGSDVSGKRRPFIESNSESINKAIANLDSLNEKVKAERSASSKDRIKLYNQSLNKYQDVLAARYEDEVQGILDEIMIQRGYDISEIHRLKEEEMAEMESFRQVLEEQQIREFEALGQEILGMEAYQQIVNEQQIRELQEMGNRAEVLNRLSQAVYEAADESLIDGLEMMESQQQRLEQAIREKDESESIEMAESERKEVEAREQKLNEMSKSTKDLINRVRFTVGDKKYSTDTDGNVIMETVRRKDPETGKFIDVQIKKKNPLAKAQDRRKTKYKALLSANSKREGEMKSGKDNAGLSLGALRDGLPSYVKKFTDSIDNSIEGNYDISLKGVQPAVKKTPLGDESFTARETQAVIRPMQYSLGDDVDRANTLFTVDGFNMNYLTKIHGGDDSKINAQIGFIKQRMRNGESISQIAKDTQSSPPGMNRVLDLYREEMNVPNLGQADRIWVSYDPHLMQEVKETGVKENKRAKSQAKRSSRGR